MHLLNRTVSFLKITHNGLALGEEADFEAQNCQPALNLIRSTKLHLRTEPAFLLNACYVTLILSVINLFNQIFMIVKYNFVNINFFDVI
jgi:hypothetical protein